MAVSGGNSGVAGWGCGALFRDLRMFCAELTRVAAATATAATAAAVTAAAATVEATGEEGAAEAEAKRERAEAVRAVGAERQRVAGLLYKEALQVSARARNSRAAYFSGRAIRRNSRASR